MLALVDRVASRGYGPESNRGPGTNNSVNERIVGGENLVTHCWDGTSLTWPLKSALLKLFGEFEIFAARAIPLLARPCNKPFSASNSNISIWPQRVTSGTLAHVQ